MIFNLNLGWAQTESEIGSLLDGVSKIKKSKEITKAEQAKIIIAFGEKSLPILTKFFTDQTQTKVKSECQERFLTKGEIAIILADRIKFIPYYKLTKIQNCLMTFCENNPNFIEYYLWAIERDGVENFKKEYLKWLAWERLSDKDKRKIRRKNKRGKSKLPN